MSADEYRIHYSDRGIPLIYCGQPAIEQQAVATVENYMKWYDVYVVFYNGDVKKLDVELWDHVPPPHTVFAVEDLGYVWDTVSLEAIIGRWYVEHEDEGKFQRE